MTEANSGKLVLGGDNAYIELPLLHRGQTLGLGSPVCVSLVLHPTLQSRQSMNRCVLDAPKDGVCEFLMKTFFLTGLKADGGANTKRGQ